MVLRDGWRPVLFGLAIAFVIAMIALTILRATIVPGLPTVHVPAFLTATALLFVAGFIACVLPAGRAARTDPNVVLKEG